MPKLEASPPRWSTSASPITPIVFCASFAPWVNESQALETIWPRRKPYGAIYRNSDERRHALAGWLDYYTRRRPHRSLGRQTPLERLQTLNRNNVLGSYS
jgi:transposase InsO family protein